MTKLPLCSFLFSFPGISWNLLSPFLSPFSFLLSWNFLESPFSFPFPFLEFPGISFLLPFPLFPFLSLPFPLDQSLIFLHFRLPFSGPNISPRALIYSFFPIFYQWDIYTYTKIQQTTRVYQGWHQQLLKSSHTVQLKWGFLFLNVFQWYFMCRLIKYESVCRDTFFSAGHKQLLEIYATTTPV